jgi:hypothetical protein
MIALLCRHPVERQRWHVTIVGPCRGGMKREVKQHSNKLNSNGENRSACRD